MSGVFSIWLLAMGLFQHVGWSRIAQEEKTYDLRGAAPVKGQVLHNKMVLKIEDADTTIKLVGEKPLEMKLTMRHINEKEQIILEVDDRTITRYQNKIIQERSDFTFDRSSKAETIRGVLEGETVIGVRVDRGKWKHTLADTEPTEKQKKELQDRIGIDSGDELYPTEKIKVGHTWKAQAKALTKVFDNSFTNITGELNQKFARVEEFGGETCAVVETSGSIKCKMKDDDGMPTTDVEMELKMVSWRSLKRGIELKEKIDGKIKYSGPQNVGGETVKVSLSGPISVESVTTLK